MATDLQSAEQFHSAQSEILDLLHRQVEGLTKWLPVIQQDRVQQNQPALSYDCPDGCQVKPSQVQIENEVMTGLHH